MLTLAQPRILKLFCISILIVSLIHTKIIIASTEATPQTYYVATNGNDNQAGTLAKPWRTIQYAADNSIVKPGDTIFIRGGTYNEYITQEISGAENAVITYKNFPNETVIIGDEGLGGASYRWLILDQSHIKIEGLTFSNIRKGAIEIRTKYKNVSDIHLVNNRIIDQGSGDSDNQYKTIHITTLETMKTLNNIYVIGNYFQNINNGDTPTLHLTGQVQNSIVQDNVFLGTSFIALGISGQPAMGQPKNIIVKNNHIANHGWLSGPIAGIYLNGAGKNIIIEDNIIHDGPEGVKINHEPVNKTLITNYVIIRRNVIYDNTNFNFQLGAGPSSSDCNQVGVVQNSVAVHNTVVQGTGGTNHWFTCGKNLVWKNNLFVNTHDITGYHYRLENSTVDTSSWTLDHNAFYDINLKTPYRWFNKTYTSLNSFSSSQNFEKNASWGSPEFKDMANHNYEITENSVARDAGAPLTTTKNAGNGTSIELNNATYFSDGFGMQPGDKIFVGQEKVAVINVNYENHTLTVNRAISWEKDTAVNYFYAESSPDAGAFEYTPILNFSAIPQDTKITLQWNSNIEFPTNSQWKIVYRPKNSSPADLQTIALPLNSNTYSLTNLPNYEIYEITLSATLGDDILISKTIESFATDIFSYLPIVKN